MTITSPKARAPASTKHTSARSGLLETSRNGAQASTTPMTTPISTPTTSEPNTTTTAGTGFSRVLPPGPARNRVVITITHSTAPAPAGIAPARSPNTSPRRSTARDVPRPIPAPCAELGAARRLCRLNESAYRERETVL